MSYATKAMLTEDPRFNRDIDKAVFGVGHFGASREDFTDLSETLLRDGPGDAASFCQKFRIFLPSLIDAMARSHPTATDKLDCFTSFEEIGETAIRFALAGNATNEELLSRGWDLDDAVAHICGYYEMLKRYAEVADDPPDEWTYPDDDDPDVRNLDPLKVYCELIGELIDFMEMIAIDRASLKVTHEEAYE
jgi:hypothetical protein